ncbi:MAG: adenylate/guanylate cyclase domain-containing protein, partial [Acidiferrobacterales bacterium]
MAKGPKRLQRKLAAILYADVAGYSRLTGEDEEGTHRLLSAYLDAITTLIERHKGKIMHFAGDAVLADFAIVSDALSCAVAIQRDLKDRDRDLSDNRKVQFRIGVNLGEVIVDRDEIYGDGVNVAARLQSLAEPGGICISESVRTAIGNNLPLDYEFLGEQQVKNIAEPVRAYRAQLKLGTTLATPTMPVKTQPLSRPSKVAAAIVIVLAVAAVATMFFDRGPWTVGETSKERMALPLPDKPSIAVLPFDNLSDDAKQEYFADGMTDDLITDLSQISGLFVIARNSSFTYKDKAVKVQQVARELGVRYVLEGSVRRAGEEVRINAQLVDAATGGHLWAERYDGRIEDVFGLQDKVTQKIVTALAIKLTTSESEQIARPETTNVAAYEAFLRGRAHTIQDTPDGYTEAITHFEKAVELDPNYGRAYAALGSVYYLAKLRGWHKSVGLSNNEMLRRAYGYLQQAINTPTALAHALASSMALHNGRHEEAISEAERAIALDTNDPSGYVRLAEALTLAGRPKEAVSFVEKAMRLDPHYPPSYLWVLGLAHFGMEQFDKA